MQEVLAETQSHETWSAQLNGALTRSLQNYRSNRVLRKVCPYLSQEIAGLPMAKPNSLQIQASGLPPLREALESGWFDAVMPDVEDESAKVLAAEVWVHVAAYRVKQFKTDAAAAALLTAAASPCVDVSLWSVMCCGAKLQMTWFLSSQPSGYCRMAMLIRNIPANNRERHKFLELFLASFLDTQHRRADLAGLDILYNGSINATADSCQLVATVRDFTLATWQKKAGIFASLLKEDRHAMLSGMQGHIFGYPAWEAAAQHLTSETILNKHFDTACDLLSKCPYGTLLKKALTAIWASTSGQAAVKATVQVLQTRELSVPIAHKMVNALSHVIVMRDALLECALPASMCSQLLLHASAPEAQLVGAAALTEASSKELQEARLSAFVETIWDKPQDKSSPAGPYWRVADVMLLVCLYANEAGMQLEQSATDAAWSSLLQPGLESELSYFLQESRAAVLDKLACPPPPAATSALLQLTLTRGDWRDAAFLAMTLCPAQPAAALVGFKAALAQAWRDQTDTQATSDDKSDLGLGTYAGLDVAKSTISHDAGARMKEAMFDMLSATQGHVDHESTVAMILQAFNFGLPEEADLGCHMFKAVKRPTRKLQHVFAAALCAQASPLLALQELQQLQAPDIHHSHYVALLQRLAPEFDVVTQTLHEESPRRHAVTSGLIAACEQLQSPQASSLAWQLFLHAQHSSTVLDPAAQVALWKTQTGDNLLELYALSIQAEGPALLAPNAHALLAVAQVCIKRCEWTTAMSAADALAEKQPCQAAELVTRVMQGLHSSASSITIAASGMKSLWQAQQYAQVIQLIRALEAEPEYYLTPQQLCIAIASWLALADPTAANSAAQRNQQLLAQWTPQQQQVVFAASVALVQRQPRPAAVQCAREVCMLAVTGGMAHSTEQVTELGLALMLAKQPDKAYQVLLQTQQHLRLPSIAVAKLLGASLKHDLETQDQPMSTLSAHLLSAWKQHHHSWVQRLEPDTAASLAVLLNKDQQWESAAAVYEEQLAAQQAMSEPLWDAAVIAYHQLEDQTGLFEAWMWRCQHNATWWPSRPLCYIVLAQALILMQPEPFQGAGLLLAYPDRQYAQPLLVSHCNSIIKSCVNRIMSDVNQQHSVLHTTAPDAYSCQNWVDAVLMILHKMQSAQDLPNPDLSTFRLATESVLANLRNNSDDHMPVVLFQLQQHVWADMQPALGLQQSTSSVYLPALLELDAAQAVQVVLLMAQNGAQGLDFECCEALCIQLDIEHMAWMRDIFGTDFMTQVEALADADKAQQGVVIQFPAQQMPRLAAYELSSGLAMFVLEDKRSTPLWMVPSVAWEDAQFVQAMNSSEPLQADSRQAAAEDAVKLTAAEELVLQYGQPKRLRKKGRS